MLLVWGPYKRLLIWYADPDSAFPKMYPDPNPGSEF
jgi:hypothetical protein